MLTRAVLGGQGPCCSGRSLSALASSNDSTRATCAEGDWLLKAINTQCCSSSSLALISCQKERCGTAVLRLLEWT